MNARRAALALAAALLLGGCGLSREARDLIAKKAAGSRGVLRQWSAATDEQKRRKLEDDARAWVALDVEANDGPTWDERERRAGAAR